MNLVSQSDFARMAGVTRQAIGDAIKRGAIITTQDGKRKKINIDLPENAHYLKDSDNCQRKGETEPIQKKPEKSKQENKKEKQREVFTGRVLNPPIKNYEQGTLDLTDLSDEELSSLTKHDLDRMKLKVIIEKERIKNEKERGTLIERGMVKKVFGELYLIDRNEFLQLESTLTGKICSTIFKTEDPKIMLGVSKIINEELYTTLNRIRSTLNKYLKQIELEEIEGGKDE